MDTLPITTPRQAGIYVRQARETQGLTRATLAKKAGVSERLLASLELGDATGIRLDKLLVIFDALGLALAAQGDISKTKNEHPVDAPHADQPCSTSRRHHAQRLHHRNRRSTTIPALADTPPLRPSSTTGPSPISPCPISESRLPQTHLTKPSPKGNSQWPEHHFGPLFAAYLRERSRKMRTVLSALPTIMTMTGQPYRPTYPYQIAHTANRS